jgi:hypothetical protein
VVFGGYGLKLLTQIRSGSWLSINKSWQEENKVNEFKKEMNKMKEFKKGIIFGLGIAIIIIPVVLGIGIVNAMNAPQQLQDNQVSFAPITSRFYQFEPKEVNASVVTNALNKNGSSVLNVYKNYWTGTELVDIIEFDTGLTTQQQTVLQSTYNYKIINGLDKLPTPKVR